MTLLQKIARNLHHAIDKFKNATFRKRRYPAVWQSKSLKFTRLQKKRPWHSLFSNKTLLSLLPVRRKSYLSRAEKRKKIGLKSAKVLLGTVLVVALLAGLKKPVETYVNAVEFFFVKDMVITGCRNSDKEEMKALAGLDYNKSLLALSPQKIRTVLEDHPWVKTAMVKREWPDRIRIQIQEENVKALLLMGPAEKEKFYYLSKEGTIIAQVMTGQDVDFPIITGYSELPEPTREIVLEDAVAFLKLIERSDPNLPAQSVSEIHLSMEEGMIIHLVDFPFPIYYGKGEVKKKYKQLQKVLSVLYKKRKSNIDIGNVEFIRMNYLNDKVLVAQTNPG